MNPQQTFKASLGNATQLGGILGGGTNPFGSLLSSGSTPATTPKQSYVASLTPSTAPVSQPTSSSAVGNPSATTPATPKSTYVNSQVNSPSYATLLANDQASLANGTTPASPFTGGTSTNTTPPVNPNYSFQAPGNPSTPPGSIDPNTPQGQYQLAFQTYLQSLQPSAAETDAEKALAAQTLQASENQDYALNKPGQTLGFASGEAARVAKNDAFQTDALTNTVNADTAAQTANTNAANAAYQFATQNYNNSKPLPNVTVGAGATVYDPNTGQALYTAPTAASQGGSATDPATVSAWATNIKNGTAKLSDITGDPALKSAVSEALASGGSSADSILQTTSQSLAELNSMVANDQGFTGAVGSKLAFGTLGGLVPGGLPGSSEADFNAKFNQVKNDVILPNLVLLHGLGRITDREFQALTSAVTSLSTNESETQFKSDLADITNQIAAKVAQSPADSGSSSTSSSSAQPSAFQLPDGTTVYLQGDGSYASQ